MQQGLLQRVLRLDRDYFSCAADEIADTSCDLTIVGGKVVYAAGDFARRVWFLFEATRAAD